MNPPDTSVRIAFINQSGEHRIHMIVPKKMWWGSCPAYPDDQWFLDADRITGGERLPRTYPMKSLLSWHQ